MFYMSHIFCIANECIQKPKGHRSPKRKGTTNKGVGNSKSEYSCYRLCEFKSRGRLIAYIQDEFHVNSSLNGLTV